MKSLFKKKKSTPKGLLLAAGLGTGVVIGNMLRSQLAHRVSFRNQVVVITGGSRGLGLQMARRLADEGARLVLLARNEPELELARQELSTRTEVLAIPCDVGVRAEIESAIEQVMRYYGQIDVLINNAGIIQVGPVEHMVVEDFENAMDVHFWGPLYAIMAVLPHMKVQGGGRIVFITSIGGEVAVPHLAPYTASKFALVGLSDAFRAELAKDGILVTTVSPGLMRTGSYYHANYKGQNQKEFAWFTLMATNPLVAMSSERAANQVLNAARTGAPKRTLTPQARLAEIVYRLFPGIAAWVQKQAARIMPEPADIGGNELRTGFESRSGVAPSRATRLGDRAAEKNNELIAERMP